MNDGKNGRSKCRKTGTQKAGSESPLVSMSHHVILEAGLSSAHACATFLTVEKVVVRVRGFEEVGSSAFGELFTPSEVLPCVSLAEEKVSAWLGHSEAARLVKTRMKHLPDIQFLS